ncbi:MAG: hypothetical protein AB8G22_03765 [Saprospiraceae bacterium]
MNKIIFVLNGGRRMVDGERCAFTQAFGEDKLNSRYGVLFLQWIN